MANKQILLGVYHEEKNNKEEYASYVLTHPTTDEITLQDEDLLLLLWPNRRYPVSQSLAGSTILRGSGLAALRRSTGDGGGTPQSPKENTKQSPGERASQEEGGSGKKGRRGRARPMSLTVTASATLSASTEKAATPSPRRSWRKSFGLGKKNLDDQLKEEGTKVKQEVKQKEKDKKKEEKERKQREKKEKKDKKDKKDKRKAEKPKKETKKEKKEKARTASVSKKAKDDRLLKDTPTRSKTMPAQSAISQSAILPVAQKVASPAKDKVEEKEKKKKKTRETEQEKNGNDEEKAGRSSEDVPLTSQTSWTKTEPSTPTSLEGDSGNKVPTISNKKRQVHMPPPSLRKEDIAKAN